MQKEPQQVPVTKLEFSSDKIIDCLLNAADHQDIENLRQEFKANIDAVNTNIQSVQGHVTSVQATIALVKSDVDTLRHEVKGDIDALRKEVNTQFRFVNKAIFGLFSLMLGGFSTIVYMIMKYMVVR